jgi:acyl-CoA synthetase (AMP-forming)/AMP-acid ligase II
MIEAATLWHLIEARAQATPRTRMAVDPSGRELDFDGYLESVLRTARGLHALGIGPGSTVAWMLPTRFETMILVGALARLDAIQIPILPIFRARELRFIAGQCRPDLLVTPGLWRGFDYPEMAGEIASEHDGLETLVVAEELPESDATELPPPPAPLAPDDLPVRWILYTSGTTSDPKGVQHTDATLWEAAKAMSLGLRLDETRGRHQLAPGRTLDRLLAYHDREFRRPTDDPDPVARRRDASNRGHRLPRGLPRRTPQEPTDASFSGDPDLPGRWRAEAPEAPLRLAGRDGRSWHHLRLRPHRMPDPRNEPGG